MASNCRESVLLASYKALGLVSGPVAACLLYIPKAKLHAVICAVGNVVHVYRSRKLALWYVSVPLPGEITCLVADQKFVYAGCGSKIYALHFGRHVARVFCAPTVADDAIDEDEASNDTTTSPIINNSGIINEDQNVQFLQLFGEHLISVDKKSRLVVYDIDSGEVFNSTHFDVDLFEISALCHPATYLNKILLGSRQGPLKLFNLKTNKLVYEFKGWGNKVCCLEQSPAVDVIAVGLMDGRICVHNIKLDETLMTFKQDWGQICSIAFRTDGPPFMITSSLEGHLAVWDLEKRKLQTQMRSVHDKPVTTLLTLHQEPLLISSSSDNCLKMWIFDRADGQARLLHSRQGHSQPPAFVRFHGADGSYVLSAGGDSTIKAFHTRKDHLHKNLGSTGKIRKTVAKKKGIDWENVRLPPCVFLCSNTSREDGWDNVVCCHKDHPLVTTWTSRRNRLGDHLLRHERFVKNFQLAKRLSATRCYVTACGNFVIIGYSTGHVDVFNIQSGLYRGTFVDPDANVQKNIDSSSSNTTSVAIVDRAHQTKISGICGDFLNSKTVTSCANGFVKFWNFKSKKLLYRSKMDCEVSCMIMHQDNNLLALGLDNYSLVIVDAEFYRVVRFFDRVHSAPLTDLTFNCSGHWLFSASRDATIKVWDLPSASLIDVLSLNRFCSSLTFSPSGEYLCTAHEGLLGVYLWALKHLYAKKINIKPLPYDYLPKQPTSLPATLSDPAEQQNQLQINSDHTDSMEVDTVEYASPQQLAENLITFSGLATPRWAHLADWEIIKERNKPKEPPKKPKQAPFFLPTVTGLDPKFQQPADEQNGTLSTSTSSHKILGFHQMDVLIKSDFASKLSRDEYLAAFEVLKSLNPSAIDIELRSLTSYDYNNVSGATSLNANNLNFSNLDDPNESSFCWLLKKFLKMILAKLATNQDFELINSYLALFLKLYNDVLWSQGRAMTFQNSVESSESTCTDNFSHLLNLIKMKQNERWNMLDELCSKNLCLLAYVKSALL